MVRLGSGCNTGFGVSGLLAGVAGLAVFVLAAQPAAALKYRSDTQPLPNDQSPPLEVFCPDGTDVTGGGVQTSALSEDVELSSTLPVDLDLDLSPDDGWSGSAGNSSPALEELTVHVICASGTFKRPSTNKPLPHLGTATATATCPAKTKVTGGGVAVSGGNVSLEVSSTRPIDNGDRDSKPDDGWFGRATNRSGGDKAMDVFAICRKGSYAYRSNTVRLPDLTQGAGLVPCPKGTRVTGGGVGLNRPSGSDVFGIEVSGTFPFDLGTDPNPAPDDAWAGGANNDDTGDVLTMTTFAICM